MIRRLITHQSIATILVSAAVLSWLYIPQAERPAATVTGSGPAIFLAPPGMRVGGRDISGWRDSEIRTLLESWASEVRAEPVPTRVDPATKGVIPGINGLEIDVEATMDRIRRGKPGEEVRIAFREVPPRSAGKEPYGPIYQGNPAKHAVSFIINVAWGDQFLPRMLEILDRHQIKATFFLMGDWVEKNSEAAARIAQAGHEIASHGYSAAEYQELGVEGLAAQIDKAAAVITAATGEKPRFFSPHKGEISPELANLLRQRGYRLVLWSVDTVDWSKPGVDWMLERVLTKAHNGALILMHPTDQTVELLEPMILGLRSKGFRIISAGSLLSASPLVRDHPQETDPSGVPSAPPKGGH